MPYLATEKVWGTFPGHTLVAQYETTVSSDKNNCVILAYNKSACE